MYNETRGTGQKVRKQIHTHMDTWFGDRAGAVDNGAGVTGAALGWGSSLDPSTSYRIRKVSSATITDLRVNGQIIKLLESNIEWYLRNDGNDFLKQDQKSTKPKEISILEHINIQNFCVSKGVNKRVTGKTKES